MIFLDLKMQRAAFSRTKNSRAPSRDRCLREHDNNCPLPLYF